MPPWRVFRPGTPETRPLLTAPDADDPSRLPSPTRPSSSSRSPRRPPPSQPASPPTDADAAAAAADKRRASRSPPAWSEPLGRPARDDTDEYLLMFRRAVGINTRYTPHADADADVDDDDDDHVVGIYDAVVALERRKRRLHHALSALVWGAHAAQVVVGATLACLGLSTGSSSSSSSSAHAVAVTVLGAVNTVTASFLALVKGRGLVEKAGQTEADFRQLKAWIEETEALLALGIIGGDRIEVGRLIETAFRRYNACFGRSFDIEAGLDREVDDPRAVDRDAERSRPRDDGAG